MIIKLSDFLRYALRHGEKEKNKLAEEVSNIELYLEKVARPFVKKKEKPSTEKARGV